MTVVVEALLLLLLKYSAENIDIPAMADTHTHVLISDIMEAARPYTNTHSTKLFMSSFWRK